VLGIVAGLGLLGAEWHGLGAPPDLLPAHVPPHGAPPARQAEPSAAPPDLDRMVQTILERPLFSRTRRPTEVPNALVAGKVHLLPRLSGVVVLPGYRRAIFQAPGATRPVVTVVAEDERIADWTVQLIDNAAVTLTRAGETLQLTPSFATAPAAPAPKPQRSRWEAAADHGMLRDRWSNPHLQP
jgi:hypothetical protein